MVMTAYLVSFGSSRRGRWRDHRIVVNGILWKLRIGSPRRDLRPLQPLEAHSVNQKPPRYPSLTQPSATSTGNFFFVGLSSRPMTHLTPSLFAPKTRTRSPQIAVVAAPHIFYSCTR